MKKLADRDAQHEQVFFDNPAIDGLLGMLMTLATDHYVLRDRVRVLERQLINAGIVDESNLRADPSPDESAEAEADASTFAAELLSPLLGLQKTGGAGGRFSLKDKGPETLSE